jgi:hypothetical protein
MKKNVPHGECTHGQGQAATFYVTEGSGINLAKTDFKDYRLSVAWEEKSD